MARVRVVIYREDSTDVIEDFICENPDKSSHHTAAQIVASIPEDLWVGMTEELKQEGKL